MTYHAKEVDNVREACGVLCLSRTTLYKLVAAGEINIFMVHRRRLFTRTGLMHFVETHGGLVDRPGSVDPPHSTRLLCSGSRLSR